MHAGDLPLCTRQCVHWPPPPTLPLGPGELDLWWIPEHVEAGLPRRQRIDRLLRGILASYVDQPPQTLAFARERKGRPYLGAAGSPDFNLSDTRGGSVLAVAAQGRVGVDLERCDREPPALRLARRWFSADEAETLAGLQGPTRNLAFLHLWTAKEAACKATGTGIYGWLAQWRFAVGDPQPRLLGLPVQAGVAAGWYFQRVEPATGYTAAIAVTGFVPRLRAIVRVTPPGRPTAGEGTA